MDSRLSLIASLFASLTLLAFTASRAFAAPLEPGDVGSLGSFVKIAPYLKDPLVLIGFLLLLAFLLLRTLMVSHILPTLTKAAGYRTIRLILTYGALLALAIIALGFGLKYREMSRAEQGRAVSLLKEELLSNSATVSELAKNSQTLLTLSSTVAEILRDRRFPITSGLFLSTNTDPSVPEGSLSDLYNQRWDWLEQSRLLANEQEMRRHRELCAAITRTIDRTRSTVTSLSDTGGTRYKILRAAWDANLPVVRKIDIVDTTGIEGIYRDMDNARVTYDRIGRGTSEYLSAVYGFCLEPSPTRAAIGALLASERLNFRLLAQYKAHVDAMLADSTRMIKSL